MIRRDYPLRQRIVAAWTELMIGFRVASVIRYQLHMVLDIDLRSLR